MFDPVLIPVGLGVLSVLKENLQPSGIDWASPQGQSILRAAEKAEEAWAAVDVVTRELQAQLLRDQARQDIGRRCNHFIQDPALPKPPATVRMVVTGEPDTITEEPLDQHSTCVCGAMWFEHRVAVQSDFFGQFQDQARQAREWAGARCCYFVPDLALAKAEEPLQQNSLCCCGATWSEHRVAAQRDYFNRAVREY